MPDPIFLQISNGVGNQLFQYATGRAAALRTGLDLAIDMRTLDQQPRAKYELGFFNIDARIAGPDELPPTRKRWLAYRLYKFRSAFTGGRIIEERNQITHRAYKPPPGAWLRGYWQSEHYLQEFSDQIRSELQVKDPPSSVDREIETAIREAQ